MTKDWYKNGNKYLTHYNYYFTSNRIREIENEIQVMVMGKMESNKYYGGFDIDYLKHRLMASTFSDEQKELYYIIFRN